MQEMLSTSGGATRRGANPVLELTTTHIIPPVSEQLKADLVRLADLFEHERAALWNEGWELRKDVEALVAGRGDPAQGRPIAPPAAASEPEATAPRTTMGTGVFLTAETATSGEFALVVLSVRNFISLFRPDLKRRLWVGSVAASQSSQAQEGFGAGNKGIGLTEQQDIRELPQSTQPRRTKYDMGIPQDPGEPASKKRKTVGEPSNATYDVEVLPPSLRRSSESSKTGYRG